MEIELSMYFLHKEMKSSFFGTIGSLNKSCFMKAI